MGWGDSGLNVAMVCSMMGVLLIWLIFGFDCGFLGLIEGSVAICVFWICVFRVFGFLWCFRFF